MSSTYRVLEINRVGLGMYVLGEKCNFVGHVRIHMTLYLVRRQESTLLPKYSTSCAYILNICPDAQGSPFHFFIANFVNTIQYNTIRYSTVTVAGVGVYILQISEVLVKPCIY